MKPEEYLESVKERILTDSFVIRFDVLRERVTLEDGFLRASLTFVDESRLDFSEYFHKLPGGEIRVVAYRFHWQDKRGNLIRRWDNTPHHPRLRNFPHHIHDGKTGKVTSGRPVNILTVLDEIATLA
jgi:hypothetical protein